MKHFESFINFIQERESIRLKRLSGKPSPWTSDPILQKWRFTNIRREDDRTTIWIKNNLRDPLSDSPLLIPVMTAARLINRIQTLDLIKPFLLKKGWSAECLPTLKLIAKSGEPITNSAYMVTTPEGMDKAEGLNFMISKVQNSPLGRRTDYPDLATMHNQLTQFPRIGSFLAAQIVCDCKQVRRYGPVEMSDWWTFASSGPGSRRGLNRVLGRPVDAPWDEAEWHAEILKLQPLTNQALKKTKIGTLCAQSIQNCCCEADKWFRAKLSEGEPKQLYKAQQISQELFI